MSHHYHNHQNHLHSSSSSKMSKYDYDPKKNKRDKIVGLVMSIIGIALFAFGIVNLVLDPFLTFTTVLLPIGWVVFMVGVSYLSTARTRKKTAAKFVMCLGCGTINKNGRRLCKECEKPLRMFCTHCGEELNYCSTYCNKCGRTSQFELDPEEPQQVEDIQ